MDDEEMTKSPVIKSSSKISKKIDEYIASPVLSKKRKRRTEETDSLTPKLTCSSSSHRNNELLEQTNQFVATQHAGRSPVIDEFWSPPRSMAKIQESPLMSPVIYSSSRGLKPKALFTDIQPLSPVLTETSNNLLEYDSNDLMDVEEFPASLPSSGSTAGISQVSSFLPELFYLTPEKKSSSKESSCIESVRKKKQFTQNGMARKMDRLISRQASESRVWRYQRSKKVSADAAAETSSDLHLLVESTSVGQVHCFCRCSKINCQQFNDEDHKKVVDLLLDTQRWNKLQISVGDTLCLHPPWQTMKADTGRTLILAANLLTKLETLQKQKRPSPLTPNIATSPSIKSSSSSTAPTADRTTTRETTYEAAVIRK